MMVMRSLRHRGLSRAAHPAPGRRRRSPLAWVAVGSALLGLTVTLSTPAAADLDDDKARVQRQIDAEHAALEGVNAQLAQAYLALQRTQAQVPAAQAALSAAQVAAKAAEQHNAAVGAQLSVAQANEARAAEQLRATSGKIDSTQRTLDNFAADLFQGGGGGSQLSVALGATSPDDFATRIVMADTVSSLTTHALDELAAARAEANASQAYLAAVRAEIAELKRLAEAALAEARAKRAQAQAAKDALEALQRQQSALAADVEAQKSAHLADLAQLEAEQAQIQAALVEQARKAREEAARKAAAEAAAAAAARAAGRAYTPPAVDTNPRPGGGFLSRPVNGPVTSEFGMRFHPIFLIYKLHTGTDFGVECGTPVYAAAAGTVLSAGWGGAYGNRIMVDHGIQRGADLVTTYNHLTSFAVGRGQQVGRGQLVGYVGTTGASTGCHLHFETLVDGSFTNPRGWL